MCYRTCQAKEAEIERLLGAQKQASAEISGQKENEGSQEAMNDEKVKELEEAFETASRVLRNDAQCLLSPYAEVCPGA